MAIKLDHLLKISYSLGRYHSLSLYSDVLTEEQLNELELPIEKQFLVYDSYQRIDGVHGSKNEITIILGIYNNRLGDKKLINNESYSFVPSLEDTSDNFIKQGYEYLKTLSKFKNAVDC